MMQKNKRYQPKCGMLLACYFGVSIMEDTDTRCLALNKVGMPWNVFMLCIGDHSYISFLWKSRSLCICDRTITLDGKAGL